MSHALAKNHAEAHPNTGWKLEDNTPITPEMLAEEIVGVPRTRLWRLTQMVFIWPDQSDPASNDPRSGFACGFAIELVAKDDQIKWVLESLCRDNPAREEGGAPNGTAAVYSVFEAMAAMHSHQQSRRQDPPEV